jgi:hypothetical protein
MLRDSAYPRATPRSEQRLPATSTRLSFSKIHSTQTLLPNCKVNPFHRTNNDHQYVRSLSSCSAEMGHDAQIISGTARSMMGRAQVIERIVHNGDRVWGAGKWEHQKNGHRSARRNNSCRVRSEGRWPCSRRNLTKLTR